MEKFLNNAFKGVPRSIGRLIRLVEADISSISYENLFRQKTLTSGCCVGVTGNADLSFDCSFVQTNYQVKSSQILKQMSEFNKSSKLFDETGCVHKAQIVLEDKTIFEA